MAELCREDLASNKVDEHARTMASMGIGLDPLDPLGADGEPEPEPVEVSVLRRSAQRSAAQCSAADLHPRSVLVFTGCPLLSAAIGAATAARRGARRAYHTAAHDRDGNVP